MRGDVVERSRRDRGVKAREGDDSGQNFGGVAC